MDSWSPLRGSGKRRAERPLRKARGRRRQHLEGMPDGQDAILTDADAARAAEAAQGGRDRPGRAAWERFPSGPARTRPREDQPDASDVIMTAGQAETAGHAAVMIRPAAARARRPAGDYGTGPAYDPGNMR